MSAPRKPMGPPPARPPPARPPPQDPNVGPPGAGIKRPPGPPPSGGPSGPMKPPPNVPPPASVQQAAQRPAVEAPIKRIPPPSVPPPDAAGGKRPATGPSDEAMPKKANVANVPAQKAGAIDMFEGEDPTLLAEQQAKAAALTKAQAPRPAGPPRAPPPRGPPGAPGQVPPPGPPAGLGARGPRPLPPRMNPPGIPDGQPLPPSDAAPKDFKAPPPVRPPPKTEDGGRAPPKIDPEEERRRRMEVKPPTTEPPLLRVKKPVEAPFVKRRDRENPEMESSDEDEEEPNLVKQPLPFGVLKKEIPPLAKKETEEEELAKVKDAAKAAADAQAPKPPSDKDSESVAASTISKARKNAPPKQVIEAPAVAPTGNKTNDFVPGAPSMAIDKHFDDSNLGKTLNRGRLLIKCIEGIEIRRKDDQDRVPRNDPFIKFRLGAAERHPWKSTQPKRKQDSRPNFDDEIVSFDMLDPVQFIFQEDIQLCIELWNKGVARNELVGSVTMSVVRFFKQPFVSYTEKVPIYYPGVARTPMRLVLEIVFEEARSGLAQITVFEATGLRNIDPMGQQDPYVQFSLGKNYKKRTKSVKGGGTDPFFNEEDVLLWLDQDNWVDDLQVQVLDEDAKEEKPIGSTHFSLLPYMKNTAEGAKEDAYDLFYYVNVDPKDDSEKKEIPCGQLIMRVRFYQAGMLGVFCDRAKNLQFPENSGAGPNPRYDPYVQLTLDGQAVQIVKRTPADKDGGKDPVWENEIKFDVVDQYKMEVKVFNQSVVGSDILLGYAEISLLQVFRNGRTEFWTSLKQRRANGGIKEIGDIFLRLTFLGPVGIGYPQFRPDIDSFDDTLRKAIAPEEENKGKDDEFADVKPPISTIPDYSNNELVVADPSKAKPEFSEEEILAAFRFIDLDKNNYIGAGEIRHILVCMGEMITDEEIDMMIAMVDLDGDGQVSFKEFRTLVLHPNPGLVDMHKEINAEKDNELLKDKQILTGKSQGLDLQTFQRQKEITQREQKKRMILSFMDDNEASFEYIQHSYGNFLEIPMERRPGGRVKFDDFCSIFKIEPITEYKKLHAFYDDEETGDMDVREFLLSMMNYIPTLDKETRLKFIFEMFDELKTGYISQREVEEILRGNHILTIQSVQRKAETIMKQANSTKSGSITLKEFLVVSKKFPNILFPSASSLQKPKDP